MVNVWFFRFASVWWASPELCWPIYLNATFWGNTTNGSHTPVGRVFWSSRPYCAQTFHWFDWNPLRSMKYIYMYLVGTQNLPGYITEADISNYSIFPINTLKFRLEPSKFTYTKLCEVYSASAFSPHIPKVKDTATFPGLYPYFYNHPGQNHQLSDVCVSRIHGFSHVLQLFK